MAKVGKQFGAVNRKLYKWKCAIYDKETGQVIKEGKFHSIQDLNTKLADDLKIKISHELAYRLHTGARADVNMRNKEHSFYQKYGHIKLEKIHEIIQL